MRKMASIRTINKISPIMGADNIVCARVDGWEVVIRKNEFNEGDLCVYCEIDSKLPKDNPSFAFLKSKKIKTIKLKGQISQGICFPMTILPGGCYEVGQDVSEILGIEKYETPLPAQLAGKIKGYFPGFIPRTDEERVQNIPHIIEEYAGTILYITEKLDGSSITVYIKDGKFGVCSHNLELKIDDPDNFRNTFFQTAIRLDLENKIKQLGFNVVLQGELVGPGIQKNVLALKEHDIYFYNVFDIDTKRYLDKNDFVNTIRSLGLKTVPILDNILLNHSVHNLVDMSFDRSKINPKVHREGIVLRPLNEMWIDGFGRFSFKVINPQYLLKYEE
jgi:RNA ligase (TIGR02306 family)